MLDFKTIPPLMVTGDLPKKRIENYYKPPTPELIAYLDFSVSTTGVCSGVRVSANTVNCNTVLNVCVCHIPSGVTCCYHGDVPST